MSLFMRSGTMAAGAIDDAIQTQLKGQRNLIEELDRQLQGYDLAFRASLNQLPGLVNEQIRLEAVSTAEAASDGLLRAVDAMINRRATNLQERVATVLYEEHEQRLQREQEVESVLTAIDQRVTRLESGFPDAQTSEEPSQSRLVLPEIP